MKENPIPIPQISDTKRYYPQGGPYQVPSAGRKNYRSLILKIILVLVIIIILIAISVILIKIFVLKEKPKGCSDGFFNPDDEEDKSTCYPCKSYCKKCKGKADNPICTKCNNGFEPEYNDKNEIIKCNLKSSELNENFVCGDECLECDQKEKMCLKCKTGYFIPDDSNDKLLCEKCSLNNCQTCQGNKNNDICTLCENNYEPELENNIIKFCKSPENENCQIGEGEKCLTCSETEKNKCGSCNPSYKLIDGKCVSELEINPSGGIEITQQVIETQKTQVIESTEEMEKTQKVIETQIVIETQKNQEILPTEEPEDPDDPEDDFVSLTAKYTSETNNKKTPIIWSNRTNYIKQMKVDGILKDPKTSVDKEGKYLFENGSNKEHTIKMWLQINNDLLIDLFDSIINLKTIKFNKVKNTKNITMTSMAYMFYNSSNLISADISNLETKNIETAVGLFAYCPSLIEVNINTQFPNLEDFTYVFYKDYSIKSIDLSKMNPGKLKNLTNLFGYCHSLEHINLNNFKTEQVESMRCLFYENKKLTSIDLSQFNTKNVKDMRWFFYGCSTLAYADLSSFDTSEVTEMVSMFCECHSLTSINLGNNFNTAKVTNMSFMFDNCESLKEIDLRHFNTKNVKNMQYMFRKCKSLTSIDVSSFDTSKVTKFEHIFLYCSSLTSLDLSNFNFTTCFEKYTSPPIMYYCSSLKYIDITPIDFIFRDFFTGIPTSGGKIRVCERLAINLARMVITTLLEGWEWEIVG